MTPERRYYATQAPDGTWTVVDHTAPHAYAQVCSVVAPGCAAGDLPGAAAGRRAHHLAAALNAMPEATP